MDAENSFGANIRSYFSQIVEYKGQDRWVGYRVIFHDGSHPALSELQPRNDVNEISARTADEEMQLTEKELTAQKEKADEIRCARIRESQLADSISRDLVEKEKAAKRQAEESQFRTFSTTDG